MLDATRHERQHELPSFLPDGRHFLYLRIFETPEESGIFVGSLDDPPDRQSKKRIVANGFGASYAPANDGDVGRLLFLQEGTLMAQPFDPDKLELSGNPAPAARGVGTVYQTGLFSVARNALVYRSSPSIRDYQFTWFDRQGNPAGTIGEPGPVDQVPLFSLTERVAYRKQSFTLAAEDIWLLDIAKDTSTRFTFGPGSALGPVWSPDGSEVVFASNRDGVYNLYRKPANGARRNTAAAIEHE